MKKITLSAILLLITIATFGQGLQKGEYRPPHDTLTVANWLKLQQLREGGSGDSMLVIKNKKVYKVARPVVPTKASLNLDLVDNTSDATKNSTARTLTNATISGANNTLTLIPQSAVVNVISDIASKLTETTLQEKTEDIIGSKVIGGSNVTVSYNDATGNTTVSSTGGATGMVIVADLTALASYSRGSNTGVIVADAIRGGTFIYQSTGYTVDNGVVFAASGGGYWVRQYQGATNLAWFGLVDNNVAEASGTDQRSIISQVLWDNRYGTYYIPKGTYWVTPITNSSDYHKDHFSLNLKSNTTLILDRDCIIRSKINALDIPVVIGAIGQSNITVIGGQIYGDRYFTTNTDGPSGTPSEYGFPILFTSCINVVIKDVKVFDAKGDGLRIEGGDSKFINPTTPVTQTITTLKAGNTYRVDVVGTGSISLTIGGTEFANITALNCRHIVIPGTLGAATSVVATITGTLTEVRIDSPTYGLLIDNVYSENCRRNGAGIISAVNFTVSNCRFTKANGTLPQAGLDLEPNTATQRVWNGQITGCQSYDNASSGFNITGHNVGITNSFTYRNPLTGFYFSGVVNAWGDQYINNCNSNDDGWGLYVLHAKKFMADNLVIRNTTSNKGMTISGCDEVFLTNSSVVGSFVGGIEFSADNGRVTMSNITVETAGRGGASGTGMQLRGSNVIGNQIKILNGGFWGLTTDASTSNIHLSNVLSDGNQRNGVGIGGTSSSLTNSIVQNNNVNNGTYYNVEVTGSNNRVSNNLIKKGAANPRYGIYVGAAAANTLILNNDFTSSGSLGDLSDNGTGTYFSVARAGYTPVANVNYTQLYNDEFIAYTTLTATRSITLLAASAWKGKTITIKDEVGNAGTNNITIIGTVDGVTNPTAISTNYGTKTYYSNGTAIYTR